ncbi:hypothetical protein QVD99_001543 [Batrachochytrium dendrobatidis]|nr:hypothetical protein QVD99_001543 [Batrachochytrium dendrobatidis]
MVKHKQPQRKFKVPVIVKELPADPEYTQLLAIQARLLSLDSTNSIVLNTRRTVNDASDRDVLVPQQALLGVIQHAFSAIFADPQFPVHVRTIKDLFLERDFVGIFTDPILLPVYAAEYIPCRALCYRDIFLRIDEIRTCLHEGGQILCLGAGNGSELLGIGSALHGMQPISSLTVHLQDLSSYGSVIQRISESMHALLDIGAPALEVTESTGNLLELDDLKATVIPVACNAKLITAMFILNELLSNSKRGFVTLISQLIEHMPSGGYLLVVDSAGSFSEVKLGSNASSNPDNQSSEPQQRIYMAFKLLDAIHALQTCVSYDSVWYRCSPHLSFPSKLNSMRYYLRLYQKR